MDAVARLHEETASRQELDVLADELAACVRRIDQCEHELLTRLRDFDARQGWVGQATSCARWLSWRTGLSMQAARERVRIARALGALSLIDEAMRRGELNYSKVRALTRIATPETELKWIATARHVAADHLAFLCRERGHRMLRTSVPKRIDRRFVRRRDTPQGMVRIEIQLPPADAEIVWEAIAAVMEGGSTEPATDGAVEVGEVARDASAEAACETLPTSESEALIAVRAEIAAAQQARARPQRTHSPANDAPDIEELRAEAIVRLAGSFTRSARPERGARTPRAP